MSSQQNLFSVMFLCAKLVLHWVQCCPEHMLATNGPCLTKHKAKLLSLAHPTQKFNAKTYIMK
jgi:hypothetical protein